MLYDKRRKIRSKGRVMERSVIEESKNDGMKEQRRRRKRRIDDTL